MWCEILNSNSNEAQEEPMNIEPEPTIDLEVRLCIWYTEGIEMKDVEGTSDVYVQAFFKDDEKKMTDIHWRC